MDSNEQYFSPPKIVALFIYLKDVTLGLILVCGSSYSLMNLINFDVSPIIKSFLTEQFSLEVWFSVIKEKVLPLVISKTLNIFKLCYFCRIMSQRSILSRCLNVTTKKAVTIVVKCVFEMLVARLCIFGLSVRSDTSETSQS